MFMIRFESYLNNNMFYTVSITITNSLLLTNKNLFIYQNTDHHIDSIFKFYKLIFYWSKIGDGPQYFYNLDILQ